MGCESQQGAKNVHLDKFKNSWPAPESLGMVEIDGRDSGRTFENALPMQGITGAAFRQLLVAAAEGSSSAMVSRFAASWKQRH